MGPPFALPIELFMYRDLYILLVVKEWLLSCTRLSSDLFFACPIASPVV